MEIVKTGLECIHYPVGLSIQLNIPIIKLMAEAVKKQYPTDKLNLICMGSSGAIIATIIAQEITDSKIYHIKKDGEKAHNSYIRLEHDAINVIVDDFIVTGHTVNLIYKKLTTLDNSIKIDCICVTQVDSGYKLDFKPKVLICSE